MFSKRFIITLLFFPATMVYADSSNFFNTEKSILLVEDQNISTVNFRDSTIESVDFFKLSEDPVVQKKVQQRKASERINYSKAYEEEQKKFSQNQLDQKTLEQISKLHPQYELNQP